MGGSAAFAERDRTPLFEVAYVEDLLALREPAHGIADAQTMAVLDRRQSVIAFELPRQMRVRDAQLLGDLPNGTIAAVI